MLRASQSLVRALYLTFRTQQFDMHQFIGYEVRLHIFALKTLENVRQCLSTFHQRRQSLVIITSTTALESLTNLSCAHR